MAIEKDLLDQLLAGRDPKDVFNGLVDELKKASSDGGDLPLTQIGRQSTPARTGFESL